MVELLRKIVRDTAGTASIEYAAIAASVGVASFGAYVAVATGSTENIVDAAASYAEAQEEARR